MTFLLRPLALSAVIALPGCGTPVDPEPPKYELSLETDDGALLSVWARSATEAYTVGGQPRADDMTAGAGLLLAWDGTDWTHEDLPAGTPMLNWVFGFAESLWVVGEDGAAMRQAGGEWVSHPTGTTLPLWGVWGTADDDLWAVGGDPVFGDASIVLRWNGTDWSEVAIPTLDREAVAMFKVWGTAKDDVWIVGDAGVVLRWDGSALTQVLAGTGSDLISLWGTGPDEILAVGGRSNGTITRWDGTTWTAETLGGVNGLNGVWMSSDGDATAVGNFASLVEVAAGGSTFEEPESGAGAMVLHGVFGLDDGTRFVVGGSLLTPPPWQGVIVQRPAG